MKILTWKQLNSLKNRCGFRVNHFPHYDEYDLSYTLVATSLSTSIISNAFYDVQSVPILVTLLPTNPPPNALV